LIVTELRLALKSVASVAVICLGACAGLPMDGPTTGSIQEGTADLRVEALTLETADGGSRISQWTDVDYAPAVTLDRHRVVIGDLLTVVIFEGLAEGMFATPASGGSVFDDVSVRDDGSVTLPYVGAIAAAGRDTTDIRRDILNRIRSFAVRPEVSVAIKSRNAGSVSVAGAVTTPSRLAFGSTVLTVQDALSQAGAPFDAPYSAQVLIRSQSGSQRASLAQIMAGPPLPLNGDTDLIVTIMPMSYQALGAVRRQGTQPITTASLNLMEALGAVGGLDGARANARGVFLFRDAQPGDADRRPIVYQLDMRSPDAFAVARRFQVMPDDVIYVTEAPVAQWTKVLSAIQGTIGVGSSAAALDRLARN